MADAALYTLRVELRLRTLHYLDRAIREGSYRLTEDVAEPDPFVIDLNADLTACDEGAAATLTPRDRRFVLCGLAELMDAVLVRCVRDLGPINAMGTNKMLRNVLALQQNLRNLGESPIEVDFRSRRYWSLAGSGDVKVRLTGE